MIQAKVHIGTSGWHYKHWKGTFYPADIKEKDQLAEYQKTFSTVEINNSFYRVPSPETFATWRKNSQRSFIYAVKAHRFFTHMKKLIVDEEGIRRFFFQVGHLGRKLGPVLFQLPPKWTVNPERLKKFLEALPRKYRYTFEFREPSWYTQEIYELLRTFKVAFCMYELGYHTSPIEVTTDFVYVRLHGPGEKYQGSYPLKTLRLWAARCRQWQEQGLEVFIYFDNDQAGYAAQNAKKLISLL